MTSPLSLSLLMNVIDPVIRRIKPGCTLKSLQNERERLISSVVNDDRIAALHLF